MADLEDRHAKRVDKQNWYLAKLAILVALIIGAVQILLAGGKFGHPTRRGVAGYPASRLAGANLPEPKSPQHRASMHGKPDLRLLLRSHTRLHMA